MATDQEIRDAGLLYIPKQKYLQNPYNLPVEETPPPASGGITNTNAFNNSGNDFSVYNPDPNSIVNRNADFTRYNNLNEARINRAGGTYPGGFQSNEGGFEYTNSFPNNSIQMENLNNSYLNQGNTFQGERFNTNIQDEKQMIAEMAAEGVVTGDPYTYNNNRFSTIDAAPNIFDINVTGDPAFNKGNNGLMDYRQNYGANTQYDNDNYYDTVDNPLAYSGQTELEKMKESYPGYFEPKPLEGIPGMMEKYVKNSFLGKGLGIAKNFANSILPVNRRSILENELGGQGIMVNDIGQIVGDGGNVNTAENIMAGYNASKVTADTFQKRRDMINEKMKDPEQKAAKLAALDAAEAKMLGVATDRTNTIYDDKTAKRKEKKKTSFLNRIFKNKKAADTTGTDTTGTTGTTGDPGGSFANIDNSGKNYGPYSSAAPSYTAADTNRESKRGRGRDADDKMARGGRAGYFFGGRAGFKNGGLAGLL